MPEILVSIPAIRNLQLKHKLETDKSGGNHIILAVSFEAKAFESMGSILLALANGAQVDAQFSSPQLAMEGK
jgi:hypothetical protein